MKKNQRGQAAPEYAVVLAAMGIGMMLGLGGIAAVAGPTLTAQQTRMTNAQVGPAPGSPLPPPVCESQAQGYDGPDQVGCVAPSP